jgi:apolipoprotein N-acyltransferase
MVSRLVSATAGVPYLDAMTSPCSVMRMRPATVPCGWARMASNAGPPPRPLVLPGLPVIQPLICYESLYPGFTRAGARASGRAPDLIINVSNDAWFGATTGPLQHLNLASYRAIEEGVPMVRATPTGVSAMIDPFGRPVPGQSLGQGGRGVVDARLPRRLAPTGYRLWGEWPFLMFLCLSAGLAWFFGLAERRNLDQITPRG